MAEGEAKRGRRQVDSFRLRLTARTRRAWRAAAGGKGHMARVGVGRRRDGAEERSGAPRGAAVSPRASALVLAWLRPAGARRLPKLAKRIRSNPLRLRQRSALVPRSETAPVGCWSGVARCLTRSLPRAPR